MCGEPMRIKEREATDRVPGQSQIVRRTIREWVCGDCDYYEEAEKPESGDSQA
jgi:hypothetical protein